MLLFWEEFTNFAQIRIPYTLFFFFPLHPLIPQITPISLQVEGSELIGLKGKNKY